MKKDPLLPTPRKLRAGSGRGPLVEGLVGAAVVAAGGADRDRVAAEALRGLAPKQAHLG